jgi:hypothetical protein
MCLAPKKVRTCGGAVVWGTALQAGKSRVRFPMVSLTSFLGPTKPLTKMSTRNISWGKGLWLATLSPVLTSGSLIFLEPSESEQACRGIAFYLIKSRGMSVNKSVELTISQQSSMLLIRQLRQRQGDSELNQKWLIHLCTRFCVKQCS